MSGYNFGRAFTYEVHVNDANGDTIDISDATFVSAYIFSTKPSRDDALDGTSAVQTIADWTIVSTYATLAVSEIEDPSTGSEFMRYSYYVAISFKFDGSTQTQTIIKELPIERITSQQSIIGVTYSDVLAFFPTLSRYFSNVNDITSMITATEEEMKVELSGAGFEWANIWHPKALASAVKFRVLSNICLMQSVDAGDEWNEKYTEYGRLYRNLIDSTKLEYDKTQSGSIEAKPSMSSFIRIIR